MPGKIGTYLIRHWRGEQGLAWSFWVNLVALRLVVHGAQEWLRPAEGFDYHDRPLLVMALAIMAHGALFLWQAVGVIRSGERHLRNTGSQAANWGAILGVIAAFWLTASAGLDAYQMTLVQPDDGADFIARMERERTGRYSMTVSPDGSRLDFTGTIELGVTRSLGELLEGNRAIRVMVLESEGGNIYEARGIAKLLRDRGIATRVETTCASACTTAFIGGIERSMADGARIGFHQYRIEQDGRQIILADPLAEQERDRGLYRDAGVAPWFVERMFEKKAAEMWFAEPAELLSAGVVQAIR